MNDDEFYRAGHETIGCRVCHMIGVPLLVASVIVFVLFRKSAVDMSAVWSWLFGLGFVFQLAGHWCFEDNDPEIGRILWAALRSCASDWKKFLTTGTLIACLFLALPSEANILESHPKRGMVNRVFRFGRGVILAPFRYTKDVLHEMKRQIYIDYVMKVS